MDYFITLMLGVVVGSYATKVLYEWKLLDKARTGLRLELHGDLYVIKKDEA